MTSLVATIPWIALFAAIACSFLAFRGGGDLSRRGEPLAGWLCAGSIVLGFVFTLVGSGGSFLTSAVPDDGGVGSTTHLTTLWTWFESGSLSVGFGYAIDDLTRTMLFVITGVGSLIALYAIGYMRGDPGFARFFGGVALFIFAMTTLVMADNLVLLFLGWEGVGLCSYLLIGHYRTTKVAVDAAKKAFIVNRVGDFCLIIALLLIYQQYGTLALHGEGGILDVARGLLAGTGPDGSTDAVHTWIPVLLMLGAFGKSAQGPLFVWLPDAMAGPTPVSALVHAATMVTAGVYLVARMMPVFQLSPTALAMVTAFGALTALFAATIALCSTDLKGVFAYSTVSQLGYMFVGVGAMSAGGVTHLFTHALFKALLFLAAGSVMHALAGQLDIRKMGGLRRKMPVTAGLMGVGCLSLAGVPFISAGYFSKDLILGDAMSVGIADWRGLGWVYTSAAWLGLFTAGLTAFYTFRLWFRVFCGPTRFEMGDDHGHAEDHVHAEEQAHAGGHAHEPHEMPWWPMNLPLVVLAVGSLWVGYELFKGFAGTGYMVQLAGDLARVESHAVVQAVGHAADGHADGHHGLHHQLLFGDDVHQSVKLMASLLALSGVLLAAVFHLFLPGLRDRIAGSMSCTLGFVRGGWGIDRLYDAVLVTPTRLLAQLLHGADGLVVGGATAGAGAAPTWIGRTLRPAQGGRLQGHGLLMVGGAALLALLLLWASVSLSPAETSALAPVAAPSS